MRKDYDIDTVSSTIKDYKSLVDAAYEVLRLYLRTSDRSNMDLSSTKYWWGFSGFSKNIFTFYESNPDACYGPHYPRKHITFSITSLWDTDLEKIINERIAEEKKEEKRWDKKIKKYRKAKKEAKVKLEAEFGDVVRYLRNKYPLNPSYVAEATALEVK